MEENEELEVVEVQKRKESVVGRSRKRKEEDYEETEKEGGTKIKMWKKLEKGR